MAKKTTRTGKSALPVIVGVIVAAVLTIALLVWLGQKGGDANRASTGESLIGGSFTLVNQDGKPFTDKDLRGKYALIYFGYTHCPDVCPTSLQAMSDALDKLGPLADRIRPVMISVDPERDTPEQMKDYLSNFREGFIGLTGTPEQVRQAAQAFRVFYRKVLEDKGEAEKAASGDYLMDHSSIIYLMDPEGRYVDHYPSSIDPDRLAEGIRKAIAEHEKKNTSS